MAIYRGAGGAGDATTDTSIAVVTTLAVRAETAATTATTQAGNASSSASAAASSASSASGYNTSAYNNALNAAGYATSASNYANASAASYDAFDDRYLGAKASDPTVDNDGDALTTGALYYDTVSLQLKVYTGATWAAAAVDASGFLTVANNLADLNNAATARTNLGLGTAATTASTDYATAAQGALADTAVQPADITGWASQTYVDTAVSNLVDAAPTTLDTLNELAAALGDDANFSTTVTTAIGTKWTQDNTKISNWDTAYGWGDHGVAGYATYPTQTGNGGKYLTTDGTITSWATVDALPTQTGNSGKYLTTDGSNASWELIVALPDQTGNAGKFLTTDGTNASWTTTIDGGTF